MNEAIRLLGLFIRDLLPYNEQLIRTGRLNYDRELLTRPYIGVDQLAQGARLSASRSFDGINEIMTHSTRWSVPCVIEFFGNDAYDTALRFVNLSMSELAYEIKKTHGISVYIANDITDVKALTGATYGERLQLNVTVAYNHATEVPTLRIDTAQLDVSTD